METAVKNEWFFGEIKEVYLPSHTPETPEKVFNSQGVYMYARRIWEQGTIEIFESFYCFYLNRANKIISWSQISKGGTAGTVADPILIFRRALLCGASGIIICHNHPSGNLTPSQGDLAITRKLKDGARLMNMQILDHLIISADGYLSMADEGIL